MAGVRVTMVSYPGAGASPEYYDDSNTYTSAADATSTGIANGFLALTPDDTSIAIQLSVAQIKSIVPN